MSQCAEARHWCRRTVGIPLTEVPVVCGCVVSVSNKAEQTRQLGQHIQYIHTHGLRTPNEAFFHGNLELLGFWAFGVFLANLSAPILVQ